jgi:hypothetical protein
MWWVNITFNRKMLFTQQVDKKSAAGGDDKSFYFNPVLLQKVICINAR